MGDIDGANQLPRRNQFKHVQIDVAASEWRGGSQPAEEFRMLENRRDAGSTGAFDDGFLDLKQQRDGALNRISLDQKYLVDELPHDLSRELARRLGDSALADRHPSPQGSSSPSSARTIDG